MGPVMPPSKKPEGTGVSVSSGLSQCYGGSSCSGALQDDEDLDFSLPAVKREKEKGAMEDEELTNLNWLHESKNLLKSFGDTVLRSVSPVQDVDEDTPPSPAHSDLPYDAKQNPNCKPPYSFSCLIFMAVEDSPNKRLPVKDIYNWILEHFPYFENAPTGWKNSVRHNLSLNKCFKKVDKDRSQSIGKGSLWCIDPEYRQNLIQALKKTPYHSFSHVFSTPPTSPQTYQRTNKVASIEMNGTQPDGVTRGHKLSRESDDQAPGVVKPLCSPDARKTRFTSWVEGTPGNPTFPVSAFFKRNGVLLQVPPGVIQNGARALTRGVIDGVKPLPINPIGSVAAGVGNGIGNCRLKTESEPSCDSPVVSSDPKEDHNYSSAKSSNNRSMSPASDSISTSSADDHYEFTTKGSHNGSEGGTHSQESQSEAEEEDRKAHKKGAKDPLADSGYASQHKKKQHLLKAKKPPSDTLPLKKRRTEKPPESDDEEMKEAAGSLLHLAGIRSCLNNITNRTAKGQKEQKEKEKETTKN